MGVKIGIIPIRESEFLRFNAYSSVDNLWITFSKSVI